MLLRQLVKLFPLFQLMVRKAKLFRSVQKPLQKLFALQQRRVAQIKSIAIKKIENVINNRRARNQFLTRRAHVHALLQPFKATQPALIERNNFAVQNRLTRAELRGKGSKLGIALRDVYVVA